MNTEPTGTDLQKMLRRVAHLRALAARAGTQHEAETAAAAADEIIAKYRLSEAAIEDVATPAEDAEMHGALDTFKGQRVRWRSSLAHRLAKHYGCYTYFDQTKKALPIFGRKSDVEIVRYMYAWLSLEIDRLSAREHGRSEKNAFRLGAVSGYSKALADSKAKAEKAHGSASDALVLHSHMEKARLLAERAAGGLRNIASRPVYRTDAYERGQRTGANLAGRGKALGAHSGRMLGAKS